MTRWLTIFLVLLAATVFGLTAAPGLSLPSAAQIQPARPAESATVFTAIQPANSAPVSTVSTPQETAENQGFLGPRYLNPQTGRFWTRDLFEGLSSDPSSLHKYLYAENDPINSIDPLGYTQIQEVQATSGISGILVRLGIPNVRVAIKKGVEVLVCKFGEKLLTDGPIHHIATDKNWVKNPRWSSKFDDLFKKAGMSLQDIANKLVLPGHKGPHPQDYHEKIFEALMEAAEGAASGMQGLAAEAAQEVMEEAMQKALLTIASRLCNKNDPLTKLIVR